MSKRYPGGLITKTPVTPTTSSAPGVWTLEQALQYIKAGTWPLYVLSDPYFNYVTMLLHGDGTNGAQNNTFLDSSTNNFTITRNGNTTQGSFSPYGANWSNYISASNYLNTTSSAALGMGTGDFTVEAWIFATAAFSGYNAIFADGFTSGSLYFGNTAGGFGLRAGSVGDILVTTAPSINQWVHVAVTRSGTTVRLFYNGVQQATTTNSTNFPTQSGYVGNDGGGSAFTGYISNLRIVKGTAVYTSAFTPSTTPLTAISGTSLLTCQSNRFIDNSTNNFAITVNGTPSVQRFSPFSPSSAYSTSVIGGSGYFDGSGDYLSLADATAFNLSGGVWTIEAWIYPNGNYSTYRGIISKRVASSPNTAWQLFLNITSGVLSYSSGTTAYNSSSTPVANAWNHIAGVYDGTNINLYMNGVRVLQTPANNTNYAASVYIGSYPSNSEDFAGGIADVRVVKGTQLYTGTTYTVPTAPLTAISGTSLLTNFTNGGIFDNAMMNNLETVGSAQISTSVFKYGTGSMSLSASGNTLRTQYNNPSLSMGTGDFTIEGWVYLSSTPSTNGVFQMSGTSGGFVNNQTANLALGTNSSSTWQIYAKNTYTISSSTTIPVGSWIHFALVRSGTTTVLYINGTALITLTADSTNYSTPYIGLGSIYDATSYPLGGYIDDLRITKGYARYTSNFTPPAAAFPNQ